MHHATFHRKPLLVALAAAQLMLTQQALANTFTLTGNYTTGQSTTGIYDEYVLLNGSSISTSSGTALKVISNIPTSLSNSGIIRTAGTASGNAAITVNAGVTVNSAINNGTIAATSNASGTRGITNAGSINTLSNSASGTISGDTAILNNGGTIGTLYNAGSITGNSFALSNQGTIGVLENDNNLTAAIAIYNSTPGVITNGITNRGTLSGSYYAIYNFGTLPVINNSGIIRGDISNYATGDLTINGGDDFTSTLTGANGAAGTLANYNGNLNFGSGKLWLNDNVVVDGHTVTNSGASLLITNALNLSGTYHQTQNGNLTFGVSDSAVAGGTTADAGYGRLTINGDALFDAGSSITLATTGSSYQFASGQRYVLVQASGSGTDYNADLLVYSAGSYTGNITAQTLLLNGYNSLVIYLDDPAISSPTPVRNLATSANASAALQALSRYSGFSDGLLNLYNASMAINSSAQANRAGEQLTPVMNSASGSVAASAAREALTVVSNHVNSLRVAQNGSAQRGVATGDDPLEWTFWGQPFYGNARQGMMDDVSGYRAHYGGLVLGADRQVAEDWRAGGALSYSHASVRGADNLSGNHTDVDAWGGILYAAWSGSPVYLNLSASLTSQQYDSQRQIAFDGFSGQAGGRFNGQQVVTKAEAGYPIFFGEGTTLTPLAAMSYSYLHQDDYKEHSDDGAGLAVDASHTQSVRSSLGGKLEHRWSTGIGDVVPFVQAMWTHEYDRSRMANSASFAADGLGETRFTSFGATPVADSADLSTGVTLMQGDDLSLSARYDRSIASHFTAQTFSLRLQTRF